MKKYEFNGKIYGGSLNPYIFVKGEKITLSKEEYRIMKGFYNTPEEIAEYFIESGLRDATSVHLLIREVVAKKIEEMGKVAAMKFFSPFMGDQKALFTKKGLTVFLEKSGVKSVDCQDPIDGRISSTFYINL